MLLSTLNDSVLNKVMETMGKKDRNLPEFENPPLIEVALSVQFDPLSAFQAPQIGLLWEKYRDRFPKTEQHPPLENVTEKFELPLRPEFRIELSTAPPVPRCWFLNDAGSELIQVQADRFIHNWRKVDNSDQYPRYEHIRQRFSNELTIFCEFLLSEQLGEFKPNQCEITYTNHIKSAPNLNIHKQINQTFTVWKTKYSDDFLGIPENVKIATQYVFYNSEEKPVGRLHISSQPVFNASDKKPIQVLTLTARGAPESPSIEGVLAFLDKGREKIVRGFTSITTPKMHKKWRRLK